MSEEAVERPDWHLEKFESVESQAKAYVDLEKSFGQRGQELSESKQAHQELASRFGAPDEYELPTIEGVEFDIDDPLMLGFKEYAKNSDMPQEKFSELASLYAANQVASATAEQERMVAEMAKIPEAEMRIKNVQDWLGANLPDHADALGGLATDSASFVAVEALLEKVGKRPASPSEYAGMPVPSMAEIQQMQAAVDDNGQRKMQDPAYAAKVRGLMEYHVGRG